MSDPVSTRLGAFACLPMDNPRNRVGEWLAAGATRIFVALLAVDETAATGVGASGSHRA